MEFHLKWNVTQNGISLKMESQQNEMSIKMECHLKSNVTENGTMIKIQCNLK